MEIWPFCSTEAKYWGDCSYVPAIVIGLIVLVVVVLVAFAIYNSLKTASSTGTYSTASETAAGELSVGEKWLKKFGLDDDTLGSILLDFCGFRNNKIPVQIKESDLGDGQIAISLTFPGTDVTKIIMVNVDEIDFVFDESVEAGTVLADIYLNDYDDDDVTVSTDDSPDYDPDEETALDGVDWDDAIRLLSFKLHLSKKTHEKKFPDV